MRARQTEPRREAEHDALARLLLLHGIADRPLSAARAHPDRPIEHQWEGRPAIAGPEPVVIAVETIHV